MRTRATSADDGWVINGSKQFITNSGTDITSLITVTARTGTRDNGKPEISTLIVPRGTRGLEVGPSLQQTGLARFRHPSADASSDVRVPHDHLLGDRGKGYAQFLSTLDDGRIAVAALALGCIRACRDLSVELCRWSARRSADPSAGSRRWRSRSLTWM